MSSAFLAWGASGTAARADGVLEHSSHSPALSLKLDTALFADPEITLPTHSAIEPEPNVSKVRLAKGGRFLLAVGVPLMVGGAAVVGSSYIECSYDTWRREKSRQWGWAVF